MSSLELLVLLEETSQVTDWFMLGLYLKIPRVNLTDIEKRFSSLGVQRCKTEMFEVWKRNTPDACWEQILFALKKCGESVLADKIGVRQLPSITNDNQAGSTRITNDNQDGSLGRQNSPKPKAVRIKLKKKLVKTFTRLEREFANLVSDLKTALQDKKVDLEKLQSYLETRLEENGKFTQAATINELFRLISPHFCFLNTVILEDLVEKFVGDPLKKQLEEYENHLDEFTESTELRSLLKEVRSHCPSGVDMPQVVFKLTGFWPSVTIKHFKKFVDQIFEEESSALTHIHVKDGCICVSWFARKSVLSSLIGLAQQKVEFMRHVGVLKLTIGNTVVLDQEDGEEDIDMHTALLDATNADCAEAVELLLSLGADTNCISRFYGTTPLIIACDKGSTRIATMLLGAHANVNLQDDEGFTPLMVVCDSDTSNIDLVKLLVQSGADINVEGGETNTALLQAIMRGHTQIVQYLLDKGADINALSKDGNSSLMIACQYQHQDIVHLLLNYKADANTWNSKTRNTALHFACCEQLATAVELLLAHEADPNAQNNLECTPLMYACGTYDQPMEPTIPVMLLSAGANPDIQSINGVTPLMKAAQYDYQEGVEALLNAGADVHIQSSSGVTALHYASCNEHSAVTQLLLRSDSSASVTNNRIYTS